MDGITIGIVTYLKSCTLFAPSICAASISSPGIFWIPEMYGVAFEDLPEDFVCPLCGVGKDQFEEEA